MQGQQQQDVYNAPMEAGPSHHWRSSVWSETCTKSLPSISRSTSALSEALSPPEKPSDASFAWGDLHRRRQAVSLSVLALLKAQILEKPQQVNQIKTLPYRHSLQTAWPPPRHYLERRASHAVLQRSYPQGGMQVLVVSSM